MTRLFYYFFFKKPDVFLLRESAKKTTSSITLALNLPHADVIDEVLRVLAPMEIKQLKTHLVAGLIEQKMLRKFRWAMFLFRIFF